MSTIEETEEEERTPTQVFVMPTGRREPNASDVSRYLAQRFVINLIGLLLAAFVAWYTYNALNVGFYEDPSYYQVFAVLVLVRIVGLTFNA